MADDGNAAKGNTEREAYDLLADGFGPGFNGPFQIVIDLESNTGATVLEDVATALAGDEGIAAVSPAVRERCR